MLQIGKDDLKTLRISNKMTQEEFAKELSIAQSYVGLMENGIKPISKPMVVRLVTHFGLNSVLEAKQLTQELKST